ncbi:MAG: hypothetical protein VKP72_08630 [bacterium]|nr:hypothetical protein [bacterium]
MKRITSLTLSLGTLAGCTTFVQSVGTGGENPVTLTVQPNVTAGSLRTQAIVKALDVADVDHVVVTLSTVAGGTTSPVLVNGAPVKRDIASPSLSVPVAFKGLNRNTTYRIQAKAFRGTGESASDLISVDEGSFRDIVVGTDDRPPLANLPVRLKDLVFSGIATGSFAFTNGQLGYQGHETASFQFPKQLATPEPLPSGTMQPFATYPKSLPFPTQETAPIRIGDKLYLIGGLQNNSSSMKTKVVTTIDASGSLGDFTQDTGDLVLARHWAWATRVKDYLYVIGGFIGNSKEASVTDTLERATINPDGSLGAFETVSGVTLRQARAGFAALNTGSYLYVIGGQTGGAQALNSIERAVIQPDGSIGNFETVPETLLTARWSVPAIRIKNFVYVLGGETTGQTGLRSIERASLQPDGTLGSFTTYDKSLSATRNRLGYGILANKLYLFGGYNSSINNFGTEVDTSTIDAEGELSTFAPDSQCRLSSGLENGVTFMASNFVYYIGGYNFQNTQGMTTVQRAVIE